MSRLLIRLLVALLLCAAVLPLPVQAAPRVPDPFGSDPYRPGRIYRGDFPDPAVLHVGRSYYAYSTSIAGMNLPVLTARSPSTWRAVPLRRGRETADALPQVAGWAWSRQVGDRRVGITWAPSVARIDGRYVAAYATRVRGTRARMCISVATATSPRGPFVDRTAAPLVCPWRGAIDPQLYREKGRTWLLYKTEDIAIGKPTRLWIQRLRPSGLRLADRPPTRLLRAKMDWENRVVENPAMIRFRGRHYLFYSGNGWGSPHYAIGYAVCEAVTGPCTRVLAPKRVDAQGVRQSVPLIRRGGGINGPGGGFPFLGPQGGLRLAYHAWDRGFSHYPHSEACRDSEKGCAQRRMHVARLVAHRDGQLTVADLGLGSR